MGIITKQDQKNDLDRYFFNKKATDVFDLLKCIEEYNDTCSHFDIVDIDDGTALYHAAKLIEVLISLHMAGPGDAKPVPPALVPAFTDLLNTVHKLLVDFGINAIQEPLPQLENEGIWEQGKRRRAELQAEIDGGNNPTILWSDYPHWRVLVRDDKFKESWANVPAEWKSMVYDEESETEVEIIEDGINSPRLERDPKFFLVSGSLRYQIMPDAVRFSEIDDQSLLAVQKAAHTILGWQIEQSQLSPRTVLVIERQPPRLSNDTQFNIYQLLEEVGKRLTTVPLIAAYEKRYGGAGSTSIKTNLSAMTQSGKLTNTTTTDRYGKGYGLPQWSE